MFSGKWHLAPPGKNKDIDPSQHTPTHHGFDINVGGNSWGQPRGRGKYFAPFNMPNLEGKEGDYLTDVLTDKSLGFIEANQDKPFFLYMSYYAVHGPLMAKPKLNQKYRDRAKNLPENTKWRGRVSSVYAAMIHSVDESVGRIMAKLKELDLAEDTVIIFTADNGGNSRASSGGLRGNKATAWEGGVREPLIIKWPGQAKAGLVTDELAIGNDLYPTILEMAGLPLKPSEHLDGVSLAPALKRKKAKAPRSLYWHYPHYHRTRPYGAIRDGDWRLVEFYEDNSLQLFNLKDDPSESKDLAASMPDKVQRLHSKLVEWRKEVGAQMPRLNPEHDKRN